jgi:hypothetical protein
MASPCVFIDASWGTLGARSSHGEVGQNLPLSSARKTAKSCNLQGQITNFSANGGSRTLIPSRVPEPESGASANSATFAK